MDCKTVTVDGIEVRPIADAADDFEIVEAVAASSDPNAPEYAKTLATVRVYRAILGADYERVKAELRAKNGGRLPVAVMIDFMAKVLTKMGEVKN